MTRSPQPWLARLDEPMLGWIGPPEADLPGFTPEAEEPLVEPILSGRNLLAQERERRWVVMRIEEAVDGLRRALEKLDPAPPEEEAEALVRQIRSLEELADRIRPSSLDHTGVVMTVRHRLLRWRQDQDFDVLVRIDAAGLALPRSLHVPAFRILEEALANVSRHATGATRVEVVISEPSDDVLEVAVRDDGAGFDVEEARRRSPTPEGRGLGLQRMHAWARLTGGTLEVTSSPEKGTRVRAFLPRGPQRPSLFPEPTEEMEAAGTAGPADAGESPTD